MFELTSKNTIELIAWKENHDKTCMFANPMGPKYQGSIEGRFTYSFTPTVFGCIIVVSCSCGAEVDLSHSEDW